MMPELVRAWAWMQRGLEPRTRLVLLALAHHADEQGVCNATLAALAEAAECDDLRPHMEALAERHIVLVDGDRFRLNVDLHMLARQIQRNRMTVDTRPVVLPDIEAAETPTVDREAEARVAEFLKRYPVETLDRSEADRAFRKLAIADQHAALNWVDRYIADCHRLRRKVKGCAAYLNERVFDGYANAPPAPQRPNVWVREGSEEWRAWSATRARTFPTMFNASVRENGWYFPTRWPTDQGAA